MSNTLTEATLPFFETLQRKAPFNLQHISSRKRFLVLSPVAKHCAFISPRVYLVYDADIYLMPGYVLLCLLLNQCCFILQGIFFPPNSFVFEALIYVQYVLYSLRFKQGY